MKSLLVWWIGHIVDFSEYFFVYFMLKSFFILIATMTLAIFDSRLVEEQNEVDFPSCYE